MIKLIKNQKGFTLIELIIAIALTGIIAAAAATSIHQVISGTALGNNYNTAINQVRNAGYWVSRDALMAQSIVAENLTAPKVLVLDWVGLEWKEESGPNERQCTNAYHIEYRYDGNELERYQKITTYKYTLNGQFMPDETVISNSTTLVADHITSISISHPPLGNNKWAVTVKARCEQAEEERTYEIKPRPSV